MGSLVQAHPEAQARLFRSNIRDSLFWFCPINIAEVRVSRKNIGEENVILNEAVFSCKYLQGRLQVLAGTDAVHCGGGCSALLLRWVKTGVEIASPILDKSTGRRDSPFGSLQLSMRFLLGSL